LLGGKVHFVTHVNVFQTRKLYYYTTIPNEFSSFDNRQNVNLNISQYHFSLIGRCFKFFFYFYQDVDLYLGIVFVHLFYTYRGNFRWKVALYRTFIIESMNKVECPVRLMCDLDFMFFFSRYILEWVDFHGNVFVT
jgi:hypothetical protein